MTVKQPVVRKVDLVISDADLEREVIIRPGDVAGVVQTALERYFTMLSAALDTIPLSPTELRALVVLLGDDDITHHDLASMSSRIDRNSAYFYVPDLGVDLRRLVSTIDALTTCQKLALVDAIEAYSWCLRSGFAPSDAAARSFGQVRPA